MNKLGFRNIILVSLSAALLNLSFVVAQQVPPNNGALTPNFTGLNVSGTSDIGNLNVTGTSDLGDLNVTGNIEISDTLETNNIRSTDGTLTNFDNNVNMDGDLSVGSDISASFLNLRSVSTGLSTVGDVEVGGELKTGFIVSNDNQGDPVRINDDLYVRDRLQVDNISYLKNTDLNGTLTVDTIEERTNNFGTRFNNDIIVSGAVNAQSFGGASADFGSLNISGTNLLTYLKNRISVVHQNYWTNARTTYASCPTGTIVLSCGAIGKYWSARVQSVFRESAQRCTARWDKVSDHKTTAICFDY